MPGTSKLFCALAGVVLMMACANEADETDEMAADTMAMEETATISLDDVAGTWDMRAVPVSGDTTATVYQLNATPEGWTFIFTDREPVDVTVQIEGDNIVADAGPYESVRRPGVMVTTHGVWRLEGDRLVGDVTAHYTTEGADSVLQLNSEGTRAP